MMSTLLAGIQQLAARGNVRVSAHGFDELANDDISFGEVLGGLPMAVIVEEYQDYHKGPCVLLFQLLDDGGPVHALWGLAKNAPDMVTLITAYRPDPEKWSPDFLRRKPK
ncbi:DUF4258 domain-containing protein [Mesorhizobium sp. CN5-321]|jgi:hypothetical protein|uniref:DUF4258 domain-containing protein n=1 Tax=Mesorhizobium hunchu TaxID=3157708 RepID=UPI0032B825F2